MDICHKRRLRTGIAFVCALATTLSVMPVKADNEIESLENQTSALESELNGINQDILNLSEEISATEMQIEILNGEINRSADALAAAEANAAKQYGDMKARIKYMYEHGNTSMLELLFSAKNMTDFLNKAEFIETLSEYDRSALNSLKNIHQEIMIQKDALEDQQSSQTKLQESLQTQQVELEEKAAATSTDLIAVNAKLEQAKKEEAERIARDKAAREQAEAERKRQEAAKQAAASGSQGSSGSTNGAVTTGGAVTATTSDITLMAALLECEAKYDYECMLAVATVIMNRVEDPRFPNTIKEVIYAPGQFEPTWTGRMDAALARGPKSLSIQVAQDAVNGARLAAVADCYFFLYAPSTNRQGVNIGNNLFFQSW